MADNIINALKEAVQEIAETMLGVEIQEVSAATERCTMGADSSAVIGYSGALRGSLRLAGPMTAVLKLAATLVGEERPTLDKEMEDAFAELSNMIAGGVQSRLEADIGMIRMSPPVVISGKNHQVSSDRSFSCISVQFELEGIPFFTEVFYTIEHVAKDKETQGKYGFSLAVPMPHAAGFGGEEGEGETRSQPVDGAVLAHAVKEAFSKEIGEWSQEVTREMVKRLLPELAERLVREEIERIKREGL